MKCFALCCFIAAASCVTAAPFQNLGFDDGNTNNVAPGGTGLPSDLVPAWKIISGADRVIPLMGFDISPFGAPSAFADVFLLSSNNPSHYPVFGKLSLFLDPVFGLDPSSGTFAQSTASILQTGDIPSDARSIHFVNFLSTIELRVNGTLIPLDYETDPRYGFGLANVSGDISAYAGKTVELDFTTVPHTVIPPFGLDHFYYGIDSISFSPELIPEPSTWALLGSGGLAFLFRRKFWPKQKAVEVLGLKSRRQAPLQKTE